MKLHSLLVAVSFAAALTLAQKAHAEESPAGETAAHPVKKKHLKSTKALKKHAAAKAHSSVKAKVVKKDRHLAARKTLKTNLSTPARCDRVVVEKSGNAVGNPCLTSAAYARTIGVKHSQVAKAHSGHLSKRSAKKRATH